MKATIQMMEKNIWEIIEFKVKDRIFFFENNLRSFFFFFFNKKKEKIKIILSFFLFYFTKKNLIFLFHFTNFAIVYKILIEIIFTSLNGLSLLSVLAYIK